MSNQNKLANNVLSFLDRASDLYAVMVQDRFEQEMHSNCVEIGMQSPIEHLFWIAMYVLCEAEYEPFNPDHHEIDGDCAWRPGVYVQPQAKVGTYRADFCVWREPGFCGDRMKPVLVELDGHDFHDKDKKQRAYEKQRDRFFVKQGYQVLHYTGSEIVADPFKVAHEVLSLLGATSNPVYDASAPLG